MMILFPVWHFFLPFIAAGLVIAFCEWIEPPFRKSFKSKNQFRR